MSYEGLARRYRPRTFADVVGQRHVVQTLTRAIAEKRWAGAYLFIGGRGLGKTSMARLLASGLNCEKGPTPEPCLKCASCADIAAGRDIDVLEIDAASNTGVDNVKDVIIQSVATSPARGRVKLYIIDEVHMLSTAAFNALLKTIEEPPPNVCFILATTEGHKVPTTIRSRCQRFDFRPITLEELTERLGAIAKKEKIRIAADALTRIAENAEGGVRDALSALDLVSTYAEKEVSLDDVEKALGLAPKKTVTAMRDLIAKGATQEVLALLEKLHADGIDAMELERGLLQAFRESLAQEIAGKPVSFSRGRLVRSLEILIAAIDRARYSRHLDLELEVLVTRLCSMTDEDVTLRELYRRLEELEGGSAAVAVAAPRPAAPARAAAPPASPAPARAPAAKKDAVAKAALDPKIEKLKSIFRADVVEVIDGED